MLEHRRDLVDAHVHLTFAAYGPDPAPGGSAEIQRLHLREQAAAGVSLVRDCGARPGSAPVPRGPGLPEVIACGPLLAPAIPFLAHLREPVAAEDLVAVAISAIAHGAGWIKLLADAPGPDGNFLAAQPTYPIALVAAACEAVHAAGGRVAAHCTGPSAPALVDAGVDSIEHGGWLDRAALARLGARGGAWTPTLATALARLQPLIDAGGPAGDVLARHFDAIGELLAAAPPTGVTVLAGTDERRHGTIRDEVACLHRHGLDRAAAEGAASDLARAFLTRA